MIIVSQCKNNCTSNVLVNVLSEDHEVIEAAILYLTKWHAYFNRVGATVDEIALVLEGRLKQIFCCADEEVRVALGNCRSELSKVQSLNGDGVPILYESMLKPAVEDFQRRIVDLLADSNPDLEACVKSERKLGCAKVELEKTRSKLINERNKAFAISLARRELEDRMQIVSDRMLAYQMQDVVDGGETCEELVAQQMSLVDELDRLPMASIEQLLLRVESLRNEFEDAQRVAGSARKAMLRAALVRKNFSDGLVDVFAETLVTTQNATLVAYQLHQKVLSQLITICALAEQRLDAGLARSMVVPVISEVILLRHCLAHRDLEGMRVSPLHLFVLEQNASSDVDHGGPLLFGW